MTRPTQAIHFSRKKRLMAASLGVVACLLRCWSAVFRPPARKRAVVLLDPFGLGDVISHEPLVRLLRASQFDVTFCGASPWRVLLPEINWVDAEIAWGRHSAVEKYRWRAYLGPEFREFLRTLRAAARGAVGIDTRGDIRSVMLLHLAGCRQVISLARYLGSDLNVPGLAATKVEVSPGLRRWESNLRCATPLGLPAHDASRPNLSHLVRGTRGLDRFKVALVPVAPWRGKWWPAENWRALAAKLSQRGIECVGLCGPGQRAAAEEVLQSGAKVIECGSVAEWAAQFQGCSFIVTLDSGPMHLADALDVPVVALFGQGSLPLWAPSHPDSVVVTHQGDADFRLLAPTEANTASGEEFMRRISVGEILEAVDRLLQK